MNMLTEDKTWRTGEEEKRKRWKAEGREESNN
jgi:hypothetical protein